TAPATSGRETGTPRTVIDCGGFPPRRGETGQPRAAPWGTRRGRPSPERARHLSCPFRAETGGGRVSRGLPWAFPSGPFGAETRQTPQSIAAPRGETWNRSFRL